MDKRIIRAFIIAMILFLIMAPNPARAQSAQQPTEIVVGASPQANLGDDLPVQAVLADSQGHPISKEVIYFTTQTTFLNGSGDVVLAQAVTNKNGQAVAHFVNNFSGTLVLHAEFRGDIQYAPSDASIQIGTAGNGQVYVEHVGVDIPGFNVPPVSVPMVAIRSSRGISQLIQSLWPAMNGWPVAAVLLLVWSMYLLAVRFVFRVASLGYEPDEKLSFEERRSP